MKLDYIKNGDYFIPEIALSEQVQHLLDTMIPPMEKATGITKQLKVTEQMKWVDLMNVVKAQVEEIILVELIYRYE